MAYDCKQVKSKGVVNNSNLPFLGKISESFGDNTFSGGIYCVFRSAAGKTSKATLKSGGMFLDVYGNPLASEINIGDTDVSVFLPTTEDILLVDKYELEQYYEIYPATTMVLDLDSFDYCPKLKLLVIGMDSGARGSLGYAPLIETFGIFHYDAGDTPFSAFNKYTTLKDFTIGESNILGKFEDIGNLTLLTRVSLGGCSGIWGSVEAFVAAQRAAGRTSESNGIRLDWFGNSNVTYQGARITMATPTLRWDSAGNITLTE